MLDRAHQALHLLALDPVLETNADRNSYGFRQKRSCADAIAQCFNTLSNAPNTQWILEADIKSCFDQISHDWLLAHVPMDRAILQKWLKFGYMDKHVLHETTDGTPQIRFSAAYIHESNGEPGLDAGSGWTQEALIHIKDASVAGKIHELPCSLSDGSLRLGGDLFEMIPIPLDYEGNIEINLEQVGKMRITGTHVHLELVGKAIYVEQFPGSR
jgi:hypothetical protein